MHVVDQIVERFPDKASTVRRLYLRDEEFRSVCNDYVLCVASLQGFEARPDARRRPEVEDYRRLRSELEGELGSYLSAEG
jgi:hypothetical protein